VFLPPGEPQGHGSVENVNGWFQRPLLQPRLARPGDLRRELARREDAVTTQHVHPRLGGLTPAQHRRRQRIRKLPAGFVVPLAALPIAAGRVNFIRRNKAK
jgi:transposase InsO family protein